MALEERLFHYFEPWIFVEQFDQGACALPKRAENIV